MFGRTSSGSWGNADTGGQYSDLGPTTAFNVNNGTGVFTIDAASKSLGALLNNASARDVDIRFKVLANKIAAGGNAYVYAVARRSGNNEVRPKLVLRPDGSIQVHASALVNGTEQSLGTAVTVAGLTQSTSRYIWFHAQVSGANPTTVRVKAWADGTAEPSAWQFTATTTQASCQVAGSVGLRLFVTAGVTNAPIDYRFDNYVVKTL